MAAAEDPEFEIHVRGAVAGQPLAGVRLRGTDSLAKLHGAVVAATGATQRLRLLFRGALLTTGPTTLVEAGLGPGEVVDVVRSCRPAKFRLVGKVCLSDAGFQRWRWLRPVRAAEPGRFYVAWTRTYAGRSYREYVARVRACGAGDYGPRTMELVIVDIMQSVEAELLTADDDDDSHSDDDDSHSSDSSSTSLGERDEAAGEAMETMQLVPGARAWWSVLAVVEGRPLLNSLGTSEPGDNFARTVAVSYQDREGSTKELWRQDADEQLVAAFGGRLALVQGFFANGLLYLIAQELDNASDVDLPVVVLECALDVEGGEVVRMRVQRWVRQAPDILKGVKHPGDDVKRLEFLGTDCSGSALWLQVQDGVAVLPVDTLRARVCLRGPDMAPSGNRLVLGLDPCTGDVYVLCDCCTDRAQTASLLVYRVRAEGLGAALTYEGHPTELICRAQFGIDGFSDTFCVMAAQYDPQTDCLMAFDAADGVWALPLSDARHQEAMANGD